MIDIGFQHTLDGARRVLGLHILEQFAAHRRVGAEPAADQQMIAIDGVAIIVDRNARADQADVADIVLRTGMMAAGQMNVDRRLKRHALVAPCGNLVGVLLGVSSGETATGLACAGNQASTKGRRGD